MNALIIIYTLAISGHCADAMATTTKPLDLNDPSIIHTTQEEYDSLMKSYGIGSFRGTDANGLQNLQRKKLCHFKTTE